MMIKARINRKGSWKIRKRGYEEIEREFVIDSDFNGMLSKEEQTKIDRLETKWISFIEDKVQKAVDVSMSENSEMLHSSVSILRILVKGYSNDILEPQRDIACNPVDEKNIAMLTIWNVTDEQI